MNYRQLRYPNLDPVIDDLTSWAGWCLAYVEVAFGTKRLHGSAWEAWLATKQKHEDRTFPRNVYFPVWFSHTGTYGDPPKKGNWGHVAICKVNDDGSMMIWSSPASVKPYADTYTSISKVEQVYSSAYVGWSEDIAQSLLISEEPDMNVWPDKITPLIAKMKKPIPMYDIQTGKFLADSGHDIYITHKTGVINGSTYYIPKDRADSKEPFGFREDDLYKNGTVTEEAQPTLAPVPGLTEQQKKDMQTGQGFRELVKNL